MAHGVQPQLTGSNTLGHGREFTAELWDGYDPQAMDRDPSLGFYDQDDFMNPPNFPANTAITALSGKYKALTTNNTGCQIVALPGQGGILSLEHAASSGDNDEAYLQSGRSHILALADEDDTFPYHHVARVRFGVRWATSSVTDNVNGMFLGLSARALTTTDLTDNDAALASAFNGIGIHILQADGNAVNVVYKEDGTTAVTVIAAAHAPVVDTWYTFEMDFNPFGNPNELISFWINGVKSGTFVTRAQFTATATLGPYSSDSVSLPMGATFLHKAGSDAAGKTYLGGYRVWSEIGKARGNEVCG